MSSGLAGVRGSPAADRPDACRAIELLSRYPVGSTGGRRFGRTPSVVVRLIVTADEVTGQSGRERSAAQCRSRSVSVAISSYRSSDRVLRRLSLSSPAGGSRARTR